MKYFLKRLFFIIGLPFSIICLYNGFVSFMTGDMGYSLLQMLIGVAYWLHLFVKSPKPVVRKRFVN